MIGRHLLAVFESDFKPNNESDSNPKAEQMYIISCSLWKGKEVSTGPWNYIFVVQLSMILQNDTSWPEAHVVNALLWELPPLHATDAGNHNWG